MTQCNSAMVHKQPFWEAMTSCQYCAASEVLKDFILLKKITEQSNNSKVLKVQKVNTRL